MSSVSVSLDSALISLAEKEPGKYSAESVAPAKSGSYPLSVTMVSNLGQTIEKKDVAILSVTEPAKPVLMPRFANVKSTTEGTKVTFQFEVLDAPADLNKFKIAYGESADALSKEVMTYSTGKIQ